jgi:hypothetical protein
MGLDKTHTKDDRMIGSTLFQGKGARRIARMVGLGYGLVHALCFGLSVWGYDARILAHSRAELACAKLGMGLPLLLLIGAATGALAGKSDRAGVWVGAWMASGALAGIVVGEMPFAGYTLATWIVEPRLRGVNVYPMGPSAAARGTFVAVVTGCMGSAVGLAGYLLMERARGLAAPAGGVRGRRSLGTVLTLSLLLSVLPGLAGDEIIHRVLRIRQQTVHTVISTGPAEDLNYGEVATYRNRFSARYTLHLVDYDLGIRGRETIDVAFDNGFAMRCQISGYGLAGCSPISPKFEAWMDGLIQEGLRGGLGPELASQAGRVSVDEGASRWLASQREYISDRYEISRDTQRGGWVIMSAHFDTGYVLNCYFRGDSPVIVDRCSEKR